MLKHLKPGIKLDNFSALRKCPLNGYILFPDAVIRKAEDEITQFETNKHTSQPGLGHWGFASGHKKQQTGINPILPVTDKIRTLSVLLVWPEKKCQPGKLLMDVVDPVVEAGEDISVVDSWYPTCQGYDSV